MKSHLSSMLLAGAMSTAAMAGEKPPLNISMWPGTTQEMAGAALENCGAVDMIATPLVQRNRDGVIKKSKQILEPNSTLSCTTTLSHENGLWETVCWSDKGSMAIGIKGHIIVPPSHIISYQQHGYKIGISGRIVPFYKQRIVTCLWNNAVEEGVYILSIKDLDKKQSGVTISFLKNNDFKTLLRDGWLLPDSESNKKQPEEQKKQKQMML